MTHHIYNWQELNKDKFFNSAAILGNGASLSICDTLNYPSLFERAKIQGLNENSINLFDQFDTQDFEKILYFLISAKKVNHIHAIDNKLISETYANISESLFRTVRGVHPDYNDVKHIVLQFESFFKNFKYIFSLNYDLLVYWVMYQSNKRQGGNWFKDCFCCDFKYHEKKYGMRFESEWEPLQDPHASLTGATLVFYPHGNLSLSIFIKDNLNIELKIVSPSENQLDKIIGSWEGRDYLPLYVAEGDSESKKNKILSSPYLSNIYTKAFEHIESNITFFGFGFGEQDNHILERLQQINKRNSALAEHVAVSVRQNNEMELFCTVTESKIKKYLPNCKVWFYGSESIFLEKYL